MITWRRELVLECDCLEVLILDDLDTKVKNPTPKTFRKIAIKIGWKIDGDKCWCPKCKELKDE